MTAGETLLRSPEVDLAAQAVGREVDAQVAAALQGPVGTALAASAPGDALGEHQDAAQARALLHHAIPRTFIAVGAALTTAYAAVSDGDEVRAAGALRCAQALLFPADPLGQAAVATASRAALAAAGTTGYDAPAASAEVAAQMERRVVEDVDRLERAYLAAAPHLRVAALGAYSWKQASGGAGPESAAARAHLAPFIDGLTRWAFYADAALDGVRRDDWVRAGAALVAARRVTAGG